MRMVNRVDRGIGLIGSVDRFLRGVESLMRRVREGRERGGGVRVRSMVFSGYD